MDRTSEYLAALHRIGAELSGIRQVLETLAAPPIPEPPPAICPHLQEWRTDFGTTNGQPDWQCQCGFRSIPTA